MPAQEIHASVVSVAHVQAEILSTPIEEGREVMDLALRAFVLPGGTTPSNSSMKGAGPVFSGIAQLDLRIDDDEDLGDMSPVTPPDGLIFHAETHKCEALSAES